MDLEAFPVVCPYCGEPGEMVVEGDVHGQFVQDCEVCCNPWLVRVVRDGAGCDVYVTRNDGAE